MFFSEFIMHNSTEDISIARFLDILKVKRLNQYLRKLQTCKHSQSEEVQPVFKKITDM